MKYNTKYHKLAHGLFKCLKLKGNSNTRGIPYPMRGDSEARAKAIKNHIELLEQRYPEHIRREAVELLQERLELLRGGNGKPTFEKRTMVSR